MKKSNGSAIPGLILLILIVIALCLLPVKPHNIFSSHDMNSINISEQEEKIVDIKSISLSVNNKKIFIGDTFVIEVIYNPYNATNKAVTWNSSNKSVATVTNGKVKGVGVGTTTITAKTSNGKIATCKVTVEKRQSGNISVSSISLDKTKLSLEKGNNYTLKVSISPSNATNKTITWSSSDNNIATVTNGKVVAKSVGNVTIKATSHNGKVATCTVTVTDEPSIPIVPVDSIKITNTENSLMVLKTLTLSALISPSNASNKTITWKSSDTSIATVTNGVVKGIKAGNVVITATSNNGKSDSINLTIQENTQTNAKVYFLNVYNQKSILDSLVNDSTYSSGYPNGMSIIVESLDKKFVLIDTGFKNKAIIEIIYNQLKEAQKKDVVTIDYMIITHAHSDHTGNALSIINDNRIDVKKVIVKKESQSPTTYNNIKNIMGDNVIALTGDGQTIKLGNYLELMLFNTKDVYLNKDCTKKGYRIVYSSNYSNALKYNGKYYYFDGSNYPKIKLQATTTLKYKNGTYKKGIDNYFYAYFDDELRRDCNNNANSIATLIKVKTSNGNQYMYFTGDLDNSGYPVEGKNGIYGNNATLLFDKNTFKLSSETGMFGNQVNDQKNLAASETNVAKAIKNKIGSGINNIKIYQISHHGINNAPDAIKLLNLNRSGVYAVYPLRSNPSTSKSFTQVRTYYYTLSKSKKLVAGGKTKKGVYCIVKDLGSASCKNY